MKKPSNELAVIQEEISPIVDTAQKMLITNDDEKAEAAEMLSQLNKAADRVEAEKAKVMRPLLDAQKAERARWKPIETIYEAGITILRRKLGEYQQKQIELKRIADEKIAARVGAGKGKLQPETAIAQMEKNAGPDKKTETDSGVLTFRTDYDFEIIDIDKIPREYLLVDEAKIKKAIKSPENRNLPGIRVFEIQVPVNKR